MRARAASVASPSPRLCPPRARPAAVQPPRPTRHASSRPSRRPSRARPRSGSATSARPTPAVAVAVVVAAAVGGEMNAFTTKEYTAFYTRLLDDDLDLGLDILCDILTRPAFRPDEVESERQVILEEILMHEDEPSDLVHDLFTEALFPGHPLGREVLGSAETISALSRDAIAGHFATHYRPPNLVLAGAGNLHHDQIAAGIERRMSPVPGQRPVRDGLELAPPRLQIVSTRPTEQSNVVVGMPALSPRD